MDGVRHYQDLDDALDGHSYKVLTAARRRLECAGQFRHRRTRAGTPPTYPLSSRGLRGVGRLGAPRGHRAGCLLEDVVPADDPVQH